MPILVGRPYTNPSPTSLNEENSMTANGSWHVCKGTILNLDTEFNLYEISVHHPINASSFTITDATSLKDPKEDGVYAKYSRVFLLVPFYTRYGRIEYNKYAGHSLILGSTKWVDVGTTPMNRPDHPDFGILSDPDNRGMYNSASGCGALFTSSGEVHLIAYNQNKTGAARPRLSLSPNGVNAGKDAIYQATSNHHTVIGSFDDPLSREHFGIDDNAGQAIAGSDFKTCRRSFVTKSQDVTDGFVSTCDGTNDPFWGPNNQTNTIIDNDHYIHHKIVDTGKMMNRLETRIGHIDSATPKDFARITLMTMNQYEQFSGRGTTNLSLRNTSLTSRFSFRLAYDGSFEMWSGNQMIGRGNEQSMNIQIIGDNTGILTVNTQKTIQLNAGNTQIIIDSTNGISIKDSNGHNLQISSTGITVNGKNIVHAALYDLLITHQADFSLSPAVGPVPISPAVIAELQAKIMPGTGNLLTNDAAVLEAWAPTSIQTLVPEK